MKRVRLNLEFPPDVYKQMTDLQRKTGAASVTEVMRRAIAVYGYVTSFDGEMWIEGKNGKSDVRIKIL